MNIIVHYKKQRLISILTSQRPNVLHGNYTFFHISHIVIYCNRYNQYSALLSSLFKGGKSWLYICSSCKIRPNKVIWRFLGFLSTRETMNNFVCTNFCIIKTFSLKALPYITHVWYILYIFHNSSMFMFLPYFIFIVYG